MRVRVRVWCEKIIPLFNTFLVLVKKVFGMEKGGEGWRRVEKREKGVEKGGWREGGGRRDEG